MNFFGSVNPDEGDQIPEGAEALFEVSRDTLIRVNDFMDEQFDLIAKITFPIFGFSLANGMNPTAGRGLANIVHDVVMILLSIPGIQLPEGNTEVLDNLRKVLDELPNLDLDKEFEKFLDPNNPNNPDGAGEPDGPKEGE